MTIFPSRLRFCLIWFPALALLCPGQTRDSDVGIAVKDALVTAKCGSCHSTDDRGFMDRISFVRSTPEGWQDVLKRMIVVNGASLTPVEARSMVRYLSSNHGLAPEEARPVMYDVERRIHDETNSAVGVVRDTCTRCHSLARALSWRRSAEDWKRFGDKHAERFRFALNQEAVAFLAKAAPLHTPEWAAWSSRKPSSDRSLPQMAGRWLVTASLAGKGKFNGEMRMDPAGDEEFTTTVRLTSVKDGSTLTRTGRSAVYGSYNWRGRSKGSGTAPKPGDPASEAREVMWFSPDHSFAEGRWYWGQYQEFGFDVQLRRPAAGPTLLSVGTPSLKVGSAKNQVRLFGDNFPSELKPSDLGFGPGISIGRIVSVAKNEVTAEVDVAANAVSGLRDVTLGPFVLNGAIAVYDRIDYIKVSPESSMAAFGDRTHPRGYQQFAVAAFHRGPDGKPRTPDDVELGPVEVDWSLEVFYAADGEKSDHVGAITAEGFFTPAATNPDANFDVWAAATAKDAKGVNGKPLVGKSYMVVTVPTYVFNGRRYVRDLDRWVDDGPAADRQ